MGTAKIEDTHVEFELKAPYYSAWQKYGWPEREPGFGIAKRIIQTAYRLGKKIKVTHKGVEYEISPKDINEFYMKSKIKPVYMAHETEIIEVPRSMFFPLPIPAGKVENYEDSLF